MPGPLRVIGWGTGGWSVLAWGVIWDLATLAAAIPWEFKESRKTNTLRKTKGDTMDTVIVLRDSVGTAIDLTEASEIRFQMQNRATGLMEVSKTLDLDASLFDPTGGKFILPWVSADVDTVGEFWAEVEVDFGADTLKIPNIGHNIVIIQEEVH